ncbi:MAG: isochorismatase family protein [Candidatus Omnitrophica bacterium]|nr:isochorismatase family protein [Candidatus Omnitrophota bacterium]
MKTTRNFCLRRLLFLSAVALAFPLQPASASGNETGSGYLESAIPNSSPLLELQARCRHETSPGSGQFQVEEKTLRWDPKKTAIIICDMWDKHWCKGATERVAEMAPVMNRAISAARQRGVLIIHAPSDTMAFYKNFPQRKRTQQAPQAPAPANLTNWQSLDRSKEGPLPIDDSDGGCDCETKCVTGNPWRSEISVLQIAPSDAVSDSGTEIYNLLQQDGIENVIFMGVHANMCVLGRPFGIRQMVRLGKNVVLMRDMTDTMYNSRMPPYVSHFRGTELVVEHIEKCWCPSITSTAFTGESPFHFKADRRPKIVLVSAEPEYDSKDTLPAFAKSELEYRFGFPCTVVQSDIFTNIPGIEQLDQADLAILFIRRSVLPPKQFAVIQRYLNSGKPLVALRTSCHAFQNWLAFDGIVLGCHYTGHFADTAPRGSRFAEPPTYVRILPEAEGNPILTGIPRTEIRMAGTLYNISPLAPGTTPLLIGRSGDQKPEELVAWTTYYHGARVFFTTLGHPEDFNIEPFRRLLSNGILWALDMPIVKIGRPPD